jgi:hypothetical protein
VRIFFPIVLAFAALALGAQCNPVPVPPPQPVATGGAVSTGGASASGGVVASGGQTGAAGSVATGGSAATSGAVAVVVEFPACNPASQKASPVVRHVLGPKRKPIVKRPRSAYLIVGGLANVMHRSNVDFSTDQFGVGACTGEATTQIWATLPFPGFGTFESLNQLALDVYSDATKVDPFTGAWPPDDTGSNGDSAMRVAVKRKMFTGYKSVASFVELQELGQKVGCIFGSNWTDSMFAPDRCGQIHVTGEAVGGHEWGVVGFDFDRKLVWAQNSWGNDWGVKLGKKGGYFNLTFGDFVKLWNDGGEAECPTVPQ